MKRFATVAALATLMLAGCGGKPPPQPGVYELGIDEAYRKLATSELPDLVYHRQCGILIHITPEAWSQFHKIIWKVTSDGQEVARFTAQLTAIDAAHTKVEVQMPADPAGGEIYDGGKFYPYPAFNQPLKPAIEEQLAALLEARPFDMKKMGAPTDRVCLTQRGALESDGKPFHIDGRPRE